MACASRTEKNAIPSPLTDTIARVTPTTVYVSFPSLIRLRPSLRLPRLLHQQPNPPPTIPGADIPPLSQPLSRLRLSLPGLPKTRLTLTFSLKAYPDRFTEH